VRQVPYRLPQLIEAVAAGQVIFIPGGEKCCDALVELGFPATCNSGGEGKWPDQITPYFKGSDIVILPDNDEPGRKHAKLVASKLHGVAKRIRILELPGLRPKDDIADWLAAGGTREELLRLVEASPEFCGEVGGKEQTEALTDAEFEAELQRLAALSKTRYERERAASASRLGIPMSRLDRLVADERKGNEPQGQGRPIEFQEPEPWPEAVEGLDLIARLEAGIARYVALPKDSAFMVALWALHTFCFEAFTCTPRLAVTSPEKRCGKTTLLDVLAELVPRRLLTGSATAASLFRVIEPHRPVILIDEADTFLGDNEELLGILNQGHRRGGQVLRTVGDDHEPRAFAVHAPAAIAKIGHLPGTLADRSITIQLRRLAPGEKVARFRAGRAPELAELARKAARWVADNQTSIEGREPGIPDQIFNRQADNWEPLLAIAEATGPEIAERARQVALAACGASEDESLGVRLLADIKLAFKERAELPSAIVVEALKAMADRPWSEANKGKPITQNWLARKLRQFGIFPTLVTDERRGGYKLDSFKDAFSRYIPASEALILSKPNQINDLAKNQSSQKISGREVAKSPNTLNLHENERLRGLNPQKGANRDVSVARDAAQRAPVRKHAFSSNTLLSSWWVP
jgi:putative DNA primase/helicase